MLNKWPEPIDYLVIGHVTNDVLPGGGLALGGTASYAALTIEAMGLRPAIVTAVGEDAPLDLLASIPIAGVKASSSTTFENTHDAAGRTQLIRHVAPLIQPNIVPEVWRRAPVVHFGPLANEIDLDLLRIFPDSMICLTLQGWLRSWDAQGRVFASEWPEYRFVLSKAAAAVMSIEDVKGDDAIIAEFAASSEILVVTEAERGGRIFIRDEEIRYETPEVSEIDTVGAGDIFAAIFFHRLHQTDNPLTAANYAALLAANSVTRLGLESIPTFEEIQRAQPLVY